MKPRPRWKFTFRYAAAGIWYALRTQRNMKVHLAMAILVTAGAIVFHLPPMSWVLLLLTISSVIGLELVNTALETVVDLVTEEWHPLAKIAKDTAAGAVLIAAFFSVVIGIVLFYSPVCAYFGWG
ncbi:diacylglycerol kinase family protein [Paenibacillus physcomitrellae]|uniref:Diacylglycerol kinase n=1 Tax=Paenibacillus physcomitrellae TaxID=1619311 RepID=A0ABQ1FML8_9BACL|nr:diacylglycerol kinase family protein [Paenibacillus physcomitrellae]GGA20488.1 diacylglycerol kinase [Paenibacillus physcomitrellae]